MIELLVDLAFTCGRCGHNVDVTLKCSGKGLSYGQNTVAAVPLSCPTCHAINQVQFDSNGAVHDVTVAPVCRLIPEPSIN